MRYAECHPDRKHYAKNLCVPCYQKTTYHKHPQENAARVRSYNQKNMWHKRGIDIDEERYQQQLLKQKGVCAVCGRPPGKHRLSVDHSHTTGQTRGLLCTHCNKNLVGSIEHDYELFLKAMSFLVFWKHLETKETVRWG